MAKSPLYIREINDAFEYLLEEYCNDSPDITESIAQIETPDNNEDPKFSITDEEKAVESFLNTTLSMFSKLSGTIDYR
ncbi:MAG: hypothetical protein PF503_21790 [Desulfobacula sp.]|nr:hypothetical protein [Desulfobacula sp.]